MAGNSLLVDARTFVASAARTVDGTSTAFDTNDWELVVGLVDVTAVSGTPSMLVRLQTTYDGTNWTDISTVSTAVTTATRWVIANPYPTATTTTVQSSFQSTDGVQAAGSNSKAVPLGLQCRWQWSITGGTPSLTFSITGLVRRIS